MRVLVVTSSKYLWAMRPFAYLFNTFWSTQQPVTVLSDVQPDFDLPENFEITTPDPPRKVPKDQWSNLLIACLEDAITDDLFVLMLEDYWLVRTVDLGAIPTLAEYMTRHPDIARMDLTADRQFNGGAKFAGFFGQYDLVETPAPSDYQLSLQAGIWRRAHLLEILRPGWDAWQTELEGTTVLNARDDLRVFGTCQRPMRYANALKGGNAQDLRPEEMAIMPGQHVKKLYELGFLK